jgi:hypothetical protein
LPSSYLNFQQSRSTLRGRIRWLHRNRCRLAKFLSGPLYRYPPESSIGLRTRCHSDRSGWFLHPAQGRNPQVADAGTAKATVGSLMQLAGMSKAAGLSTPHDIKPSCSGRDDRVLQPEPRADSACHALSALGFYLPLTTTYLRISYRRPFAAGNTAFLPRLARQS